MQMIRLTPSQQVQQHILRQKMQSLGRAVIINPADTSPLPFVKVTTPYVAYPAPAAAATVLLTYTVPAGLNGVVTLLGIFNVGASFVSGSGQVIWRVLVNDAAVKGMENLQSPFGTDSLPLPVAMPLVENDTLKITVEIPNGQAALAFPANSTGARIQGSAGHASITALAGLSGQGGSGSGSGVNPSSPVATLDGFSRPAFRTNQS
ncbi:MAG: hypothetical protein LAP21_08465 [Acidobacteriia bacterium]|nr:hypothetical protein [Terriglobia bacterium]